ncbi:MAG: hypothetical protein ACRDJH_02210 [Thermomicrobiales bacterium]
METIEASDDDVLLAALGGSAEKLDEVGQAVERHRAEATETIVGAAVLPPYEPTTDVLCTRPL